MQLLKEQKYQIKRIARKYNLELILAFGSYVENKTHPNSDLDIAVLPKKNKDLGLDEYSALISDLENTFSGKKIDIVFINRANPLLLKKISDTAFLLFGDQRVFVDFLLKAFKYFQDYLPYFRLEEKGVRQYLRQFSHGYR